jgi:hypothetical protein
MTFAATTSRLLIASIVTTAVSLTGQDTALPSTAVRLPTVVAMSLPDFDPYIARHVGEPMAVRVRISTDASVGTRFA